MPFARIVIAIGEPVYVPRVTDPAAFESLQVEMAQRLQELFAAARAALEARRRDSRARSGPARATAAPDSVKSMNPNPNRVLACVPSFSVRESAASA